MSLILASQSPRRAELLRQIGVDFRVEPADIDESYHADESPDQYVRRMSNSKAAAILSRTTTSADTMVLAADTVVVMGGEIFGKPQGQEHAVQMLRRLSGNKHQVLSSITVANADRAQTAVSITDVIFKLLPDALIRRYWQTNEPQDKAGGYAIQGCGAVFVEKIVGSYSNVVGLPIEVLTPLLDLFEIEYWTRCDNDSSQPMPS